MVRPAIRYAFSLYGVSCRYRVMDLYQRIALERCGGGSLAPRLQWTASSGLSYRDSPRGARPHEVSLRLDRSNLRILLTGYRHKGDDIRAYVAPFTRAEFIEIHGHTAPQGARNFDSIVKLFSKVVAYDELRGELGRVRELNRSLPHPRRRRMNRRSSRL